MRDQIQVRRASSVGRVRVLNRQPHVVNHVDAAQAPRRVGRTVVAIHVVNGQSSVLKRAFGALSVQLCQRHICDLASWMLEDPGDIGLVFDTHYVVSAKLLV